MLGWAIRLIVTTLPNLAYSGLTSLRPQVSALHVESALCEHADVAECAVVGLPDDVYGQARTVTPHVMCIAGAAVTVHNHRQTLFISSDAMCTTGAAMQVHKSCQT